jgi:hypothetical protein
MADQAWGSTTAVDVALATPQVLFDDEAFQEQRRKNEAANAERAAIAARKREAKMNRKAVRREFLTRAKARGHKLGSHRWSCKRCKRDLRHVAEFACEVGK